MSDLLQLAAELGARIEYFQNHDKLKHVRHRRTSMTNEKCEMIYGKWSDLASREYERNLVDFNFGT